MTLINCTICISIVYHHIERQNNSKFILSTTKSVPQEDAYRMKWNVENTVDAKPRCFLNILICSRMRLLSTLKYGKRVTGIQATRGGNLSMYLHSLNKQHTDCSPITFTPIQFKREIQITASDSDNSIETIDRWWEGCSPKEIPSKSLSQNRL